MSISVQKGIPATSDAPQLNDGSATVQSSETQLSEVAQRLGVKEAELKAANPQINPQKLQAGQEIKLPDPSSPKNPASDDSSKPAADNGKLAQSRIAEFNMSSLARQVSINATKGVHSAGNQLILNEQLREAVTKNDVKKMEDLIQKGADVNSRDDRGRTPLMLAAEAGSVQTMNALVKKYKADVNAKDNSGQTALMKAAIANKNDAVKGMIDLKANVDTRDQLGRTALMHASRGLNEEVAKTLLNDGYADANIKDNDGKTALMGAIESGTPSKPGSAGLLRELAQYSNPDLQDNNGNTALILLMRRLQVVGEGSADPVVLQSLIQGSKNLNLKDDNGRTALMEAGRMFDDTSAKALIKAGADVNIQDNNGRTVLMDVIENNRLAAPGSGFGALNDIIASANLDLRDNLGRTALIQSAALGDDNMVKALHLGGADLDIADKNGRTALMEAAQKGHKWTVKTLLETGWQNEPHLTEQRPTRTADPFKKDYTYHNALRLAERELEIDAFNKKNKQPAMDPHRRKEYEEIVDLLKKKMDLY